jgi:hypothetical protein
LERVLVEFDCKPGASGAELTLGSGERNSLGGGALLERQAAEVSVLQKPALSRTQLPEARKRIVQLREALEILVREFSKLVEIQWSHACSAFLGETGAGTVDEQIPHDLGRERQEMRAIRELDAGRAYEADICLMNQGGRVERAVRSAATQPTVRQPAQPVVNQRY